MTFQSFRQTKTFLHICYLRTWKHLARGARSARTGHMAKSSTNNPLLTNNGLSESSDMRSFNKRQGGTEPGSLVLSAVTGRTSPWTEDAEDWARNVQHAKCVLCPLKMYRGASDTLKSYKLFIPAFLKWSPHCQMHVHHQMSYERCHWVKVVTCSKCQWGGG